MSRYIVCTHAQGTPEWLADRAGKATGSRADAIYATIKTGVAAAYTDYVCSVANEQLTGTSEPIGFVSKEMEWGTLQEPMARMATEFYRDYSIEEAGFLYLPDIAAGCSVDGLIHSKDGFGIWESKSPKTSTHTKYLRDGVVPSQYMPQIIHNLWVTGAQWCDFTSYDPRMPENAQLFVKRYHRDEAVIAEHEAKVQKFLVDVAVQVEFLRNWKLAA